MTNNQLSPKEIENVLASARKLIDAFGDSTYPMEAVDSASVARALLYFHSQLEALKSSPSALELMKLVEGFGQASATVAIVGEEGSRKEYDEAKVQCFAVRSKIESSLIALVADKELLDRVTPQAAVRIGLNGSQFYVCLDKDLDLTTDDFRVALRRAIEEQYR